MALDRFVRWKNPEDKPTSEQIRILLEDYLGDETWVEFDRPDWFIANLPGKRSYPLRRTAPDLTISQAWEESEVKERWFEVCCIHEDAVDVMTRQADEYTNNVAKGFAELVARWFHGELEE